METTKIHQVAEIAEAYRLADLPVEFDKWGNPRVISASGYVVTVSEYEGTYEVLVANGWEDVSRVEIAGQLGNEYLLAELIKAGAAL